MAKDSPDESTGFIFLANDLVLDFLNTRPVIDGEAVELLPDFAAVVRWFLAAGVLQKSHAETLLRSPAKARAEALGELLAFRERLRTDIGKWSTAGKVSSALIAELNRGLEERTGLRFQLMQKGASLVMQESFRPREPRDLIAPLATAAGRLLAGGDHTRVRRCDACVLYFRDTSKKGTRRWCSMEMCGNRAKVAAYAARQREQ